MGLGLVISLYCDIRFASDAAKFSTAFSRRGLIAEYGLAWMLPHLVGHANALDLLFSARMVDAAEAHSMGLVNKVFAQDVFLELHAKLGELASEEHVLYWLRRVSRGNHIGRDIALHHGACPDYGVVSDLAAR